MLDSELYLAEFAPFQSLQSSLLRSQGFTQMTRQIVVLGGGPAGIEAALAAADLGAQVTIISEGQVGGRATWDSLVPSKVWLGLADLISDLADIGGRGLGGFAIPSIEPSTVLARIRSVGESWGGQMARRLADCGVALIEGVATFATPTTVEVRGEDGNVRAQLAADAAIIATGSVPRFPAALRPDGIRVLAPRHASRLEQIPPEIVVIGGGATGSEFTYLFSRLGAQVTWIVGSKGVLPQLIPDAGIYLARALEARGVRLVLGSPAEQIEHASDGVTVVTAEGGRYHAAAAFIAIGRTPDLSRLNLAAARLTPGSAGTLTTDGYGRTDARHIYAVGDAAGGSMLANRAMAQAWVAGRHAAGARIRPFRPDTVIHAVYTEPQIAQVGVVSGASDTLQTVRLPYHSVLKAHLLGYSDGFVELAYDPWGGQMRGGIAVGPHAADILAPIALAVQTGASLEDLAATFGANPTISELIFGAARAGLAGRAPF